MCPLPDLIYVTNLKRFKIKIFDNPEFNLEYKEQKKIYSDVLMVLKKKVSIKIISKKNLSKLSIQFEFKIIFFRDEYVVPLLKHD